MTDTPQQSTDETGGGGADKAWYAQPATLGALAAIAAIAVILIIVLASGGDDAEEGGATTTIASETTALTETTTPPETTAPPETTNPAPEPTVILASQIRSDLTRMDPTEYEMPFKDGEAESHWYQFDGTYVVVYAGWDATQGDPMCPGNSMFTDDSFQFITNSPQSDGACDPEDRYGDLIPLDDPMGMRVCGTMVLYHTRIPVFGEDGLPLEGDLYGTVERIFDGGFVSSFGNVAADGSAVVELDPGAPAYHVPEGWLPDGATTVTC